MFRKIITYFLILAVVLPVFASAVPLNVKISYAQETGDGTTVTETTTTTTKKGDTTTTTKTTNKTSKDGEVYDPCGWTLGAGHKGGVSECFSYQTVNKLYDWVLQSAIWIAGLAGTLFNASIQFSLTGKVFDANENTMIKEGWTFVRDLLNLVFIFILLFAAISTILQYGNMDIKKILPSLIIVALLVNFSMMITKMVIDASHIFAWEFYNQIDVKNEKKLGKGKMFANIKNDIEVYGDFEKKNLANVFIAGFNPQELLTGKEAKEGEADSNANQSLWKQALNKAVKNNESVNGVWWQMGLIILLESALALFAGFILLAGAIMFVARVVVLWLVMIFSPIAFLGIILPSMEKYSKMWWGYLIDQSFFAPAFLFMFMLVTKFINSDFVDSIFKSTASGTSDSMIVLGINGGTIALTFFHFFVVGGLMMACLIVAKQLGGKTAEFGIGGAHRVKGWALGGANKMMLKPALSGLGYGGRWLGGKTGDSNWFAKSIGRIPGGNIIGRKLGAMKKADEDKARKAAEKYAGTLSKAGRTSLESDIEGTKGVRGFAKRFIYTGPEGAFKPGKEGYEKIIEKKKAEGDERERVATKAIELMGTKYDKFKGALTDYEAKEKAKGILLRGNIEELDKWIEMEDKTVEEENKEEKNKIIEKKREHNLKIKGAEYTLNKVREQHGNIGLAEKELLELTKKLDEYEKNLAEIVVKEKHRENLQKTVDKYEGKQNIRSGKPEEKKEKKEKSE